MTERPVRPLEEKEILLHSRRGKEKKKSNLRVGAGLLFGQGLTTGPASLRASLLSLLRGWLQAMVAGLPLPGGAACARFLLL